MKRLQTTPKTLFRLQALSLYRDDIDALIADIQAAGLTVVIRDDEYTFDNLEEFIKVRGDRPSRIDVAGCEEGRTYAVVQLELFRWRLNGGWFRVDDHSKLSAIRSVGLDLIQRRKRWYVNFLSPYIWGSVVAVAVIGFMIALISRVPMSAWLAPIILPSMFLPILLDIGRNLGTRVDLRHKHEATTFFSRNSDGLIAGAVGTVVGAVITLIFQQLFDKPDCAEPADAAPTSISPSAQS